MANISGPMFAHAVFDDVVSIAAHMHNFKVARPRSFHLQRRFDDVMTRKAKTGQESMVMPRP